jgi:serine/threonine-protein kinase
VSEKVVDEKTDIYNLGATMYRMFTGRFVQQGLPKSGEGGARKLPTPTQINPKIPTALNDTIMGCIELSADRRPAGMFEIRNQLTAIAKSRGLAEVDLKGIEDDD